MKKSFSFLLLNLSLVLWFSQCKKETTKPNVNTDTNSPTYNVPVTYSFEGVNYSTSTNRILMLTELTSYIRLTHTSTAVTQPTLDAQKLKNMFTNAAPSFTDAALNNSGIQLKDKTGDLFSFSTELEKSFDDAQSASIYSAASPSTNTASNGVKGKLVSATRAILVNDNGFEFKEIAEKGLMGALFYYQAMTLLNNIANYDNVTKTNGSTAQEKAWDEAFGYFGVPLSFPSNTLGLKFWGSYCNSVNSAIGSNSLIMNAFLKGRAAISNNDNSSRDEAKKAIISNWEKVGAAKCISYLKAAKTNLADIATLHHNLSEGYGFITAFRYNPSKTISDADINLLLGYIGTNLYNLNSNNLDLAISKLATVFNLNAAQIP